MTARPALDRVADALERIAAALEAEAQATAATRALAEALTPPAAATGANWQAAGPGGWQAGAEPLPEWRMGRDGGFVVDRAGTGDFAPATAEETIRIAAAIKPKRGRR